MKQPISLERWKQAQEAERSLHTLEYDNGLEHYRNVYEIYFDLLGMLFDQEGKTICEIGPGDFPALSYCYAVKGAVIEPMPSNILRRICAEKEIDLLLAPFESCPVIDEDEIWLLNVMQHVIDPEIFISKCKASAKVIRFFEPINEPETTYHPHSYTQEDFTRWFGESFLYKGDRPNFHTAHCAYGTWRRER